MFETNNGGGGCDLIAPGDLTAVGDPTLSLPVSRSRAATDTELLGLELTGLSTAELLQLRDEESHLRRHAAIGHRLIAEFTSRGTGFEFGAKTTAGLLVQLLRINSYEAGQRVKAAELLGPQRTLTGEPLPPVFAATATTQASGAISVTHAAIITDTITALPDAIAAEHDLAVEQTLLQAAHQFTPTDLTHLAHAITARINPDGNKPDEHERTRRRGFTLGIGPDGTGYPSGRLTPECAAITRAWLDTLTAPAPADDGTPDPRTPAQRTHDALQTAGQQLLAADNTLPPSGGVPTTLLLTITANHHPDATDTTDTASTASTASTSSTGPDTASTGGPGTVLTLAPYATTTHGNLIPTATAMQLTDQADIITVHLNNHGGITSYGRSRRTASTSQRLALAARDRGCSFPGCTAPPGWTQAHHIRAWQHGGPTDLNNMTLVCGHHHRNFERLGWTCHMQHGLPYWTPPAWIDQGSTTNRNPAETRPTTPNSITPNYTTRKQPPTPTDHNENRDKPQPGPHSRSLNGPWLIALGSVMAIEESSSHWVRLSSRKVERATTLEDAMPAITADTLALPRISAAGLGDTERPVRSVTSGPRGFEGEGFPVVRTMAGVALRDLDPFIMMDQMGEVEYAPGEPKGTPWHPHRGFETVTYIIDGTFEHQDSHGGGGLIENGATQWMTAGAGILHIETPPEALVISGGVFHGIQLWVNLPAKDKFAPPRYQNLEARNATLLSSADGGTLVRLIAGSIDGHGGPGATYTPITFAHATIQPGAQLSLPWEADFNGLVYVLSGDGTVGTAGHPIHTGQLALMGAGDRITVAAAAAQDSNRPALEVLILGGLPIGEPVAHYGPFVMNTREELQQAMDDYHAGRLGVIPANALMPHTGN